MLRAALSKPFLLLALAEALVFYFHAYSTDWYLVVAISLISLTSFYLILRYTGTKAWALLILIPAVILFELKVKLHRHQWHSPGAEEKLELCSAPVRVIQAENNQDFRKFTIQLTGGEKHIRALIKASKDQKTDQYESGDSLWVSGLLIKIQKCSPYDDNSYDNYLLQNHYHYRNAGPINIESGRRSQRLNFLKLAQRCKIYLEERLINLIRDERISGVMLALLLGDKGRVDSETRSQFMNTGTAHILAVSGLHLGILYTLIKALFHFMSTKYVPLRKANTVLTVLTIWSFAMVTGSSSAVIRAAVMFTTLEVGKELRRNCDSVNLLGCSAFIMMYWDPCTLFDVGFQLSVVAVLSIILFESVIYRHLRSGHGWLDPILKITSVSLAVQFLITPVSMYYFGSFPVYFIISNLVWIPLSYVLMTGAMAMLFVNPISNYISQMISKLMISLCDAGLKIFDLILSLPYSCLQNLHIFPEQVFLSILSLIVIYQWIQKGEKVYLKIGLCFFAFTGLVYPVRALLAPYSDEIVVYKNNKNLLLEIKAGAELYSIAKPESNLKNPSRYALQRSVWQVRTLDTPHAKSWTTELKMENGRRTRILYNKPDPASNDFYDILYLENQRKFKEEEFDCGGWELVVLANKNSYEFKKNASVYFRTRNQKIITTESGTQTVKF